MPVLLSTNRSFPIVLDSDKGLDPEPRFLVKAFSVAMTENALETMQKITEGGGAVVAKLAMECLVGVVVGWENMIDPETNEPIAFHRDRLASVLTLPEAMEILTKALQGNQVSEIERKK